MKLLSYEIQTPLGTQRRIGVLLDQDHVLDLNLACSWWLSTLGEPHPTALANVLVPPQMGLLLKRETRGMDDVRTILRAYQEQRPAHGYQGASLLYPLAQLKLLTPLPDPNSLRDFITFETHVKASCQRRQMEVPEAWYKYPIYYKGNHRALIGHQEPMVWPSFTEKLDYELELACIIGKTGRNIPVSEAHHYILGYAILNDFSARDRQLEEMQCRMGPAKGKDFGTAMGPYIVTADEIDEPRNLTMVARVNGEVWSEGNSGWSHWTFAQMISHVSQDETLYPGDILGSGTVDNGCGLDIGRWIQPGDIMELEITGLGVLQNPIVAHPNRETVQRATALAF